MPCHWGDCFLDRQNIGEASIHFHRSLALFAELGITSERVRTEWGIARMRLRWGSMQMPCAGSAM